MEESDRFDYSDVFYPDSDDEEALFFLKYCRFNKKGYCKKGDNCIFAHCKQEKRYSKKDPVPEDARGILNKKTNDNYDDYFYTAYHASDYDDYDEDGSDEDVSSSEITPQIKKLEEQVNSLKAQLKSSQEKELKYKKQLTETNQANQKNVEALEEAQDDILVLETKLNESEAQRQKQENDIKILRKKLQKSNPTFTTKEDPTTTKIKEANSRLMKEISAIKVKFSSIDIISKEIEVYSKSKGSSGGCGDYYTAYWNLIDDLKGLLECPIGLSKLKDPAVLPSGITIEKAFLVKFVEQGSLDPFNKNLKCKKVVPNKVARDLIEIIEKALSSEHLIRLEDK